MKGEFEKYCMLRIKAMNKTRRMILARQKEGKMTPALQKMDTDMYHLVQAYELVIQDMKLTHHV